jgi:hypothetical protein
VSNEQYLYLSYFLAVPAGVVLAVAVVLVLTRPLREATAEPTLTRLGSILRRAMPSWLIASVLLGFLSVSYIDCAHHDFADVVKERDYLVEKSHEQASKMMYYLAGGIVVYGFVLGGFLRARAKRLHREAQMQREQGTGKK